MSILLIFIAGVSITNLLVNSVILNWPRDWITSKSEFLNNLFSCMMCLGFWVGLSLGIYNSLDFFNLVVVSTGTSLFSFTYGKIIDYLDADILFKQSYLINNEETVDNNEEINKNS